MFFIPRNNKFYSLIVHIKPLYRYLATLITVCAMVTVWFYGIYSRLEASIDHYNAQINQLRKQSQQVKCAEQKCKKIAQSIDVLARDNQTYQSPENDQAYFQSRLLFVLHTARTAGLSLNTYTDDKMIKKKWCCKNKTHFSFTGDMQQVVNFFHSLQSSGKMITCDNLSLTRQDNNKFAMNCDLKFVAVQ